VDAGLYTGEATRATYARLRALARCVAGAGLPVIVDAAFLERGQRDDFRSLARELGVPFTIVSVQAPLRLLRERVARRSGSANDPSEANPAVLERQLAVQEPLAEDERPDAVLVDGDGPFAGEPGRSLLEVLAARANLD
jgi:predicted kinase